MLAPCNPNKYQVFGISVSAPIFLLSALLLYYIYSTMSSDPPSSTPAPTAPPRDFHYNYTVQGGIFLQSEDSTDDTSFDFKTQNFGLINRTYPTDAPDSSSKPWPRFEAYIRSLASSAPTGQSYKVLFLARHGQGWHNVAETKYGTKAWDCYYSLLNGSDGLIWADAQLTPLGEQQAKDVNALWAQQLEHGISPPETYYVSPLTRTVQTAETSFRNLALPRGREYRPYVKELLREALGVHTCDRRSTRSALAAEFPHLTFEPGFVDADELWEADYREPASARRYRMAVLLDDVFASDEGVVLSLTSHSGAIASLLEAVGHRRFALETGGVVPVVLRAERVEGRRAVPPREPSEAPPVCDGPPAAEER